MDDPLQRAQAALAAGDIAAVRRLLTPLAEGGHRKAQALLGTALSLDSSSASLLDAERWLKACADSGDGHAAHNLATLYVRQNQRELAAHYFQRAVDSGFEPSVATDPDWWKRL